MSANNDHDGASGLPQSFLLIDSIRNRIINEIVRNSPVDLTNVELNVLNELFNEKVTMVMDGLRMDMIQYGIEEVLDKSLAAESIANSLNDFVSSVSEYVNDPRSVLRIVEDISRSQINNLISSFEKDAIRIGREILRFEIAPPMIPIDRGFMYNLLDNPEPVFDLREYTKRIRGEKINKFGSKKEGEKCIGEISSDIILSGNINLASPGSQRLLIIPKGKIVSYEINSTSNPDYSGQIVIFPGPAMGSVSTEIWFSECPESNFRRLLNNELVGGSGTEVVVRWQQKRDMNQNPRINLETNRKWYLNIKSQNCNLDECSIYMNIYTTGNPVGRTNDNTRENCAPVPSSGFIVISNPLRWDVSWKETHSLGSETKVFIIKTDSSTTKSGILETHYTPTNPTVRTMWITKCPGESIESAIDNGRGSKAISGGSEAAVLRWTQNRNSRDFYLEPNSTYYLQVKNAFEGNINRSTCSNNCPFYLMLTVYD
jgi:hypothetical protein